MFGGPYQQQAQYPAQWQYPTPQYQTQQYQPRQAGRVTVEGAAEAMTRFLLMYPPPMLVPGFVSDALFDSNGRNFYALSVEANGHKSLETFDYWPHVEEPQQAEQYVSRDEYSALARRLAALEDSNGVHAAVPAQPTQPAQPVRLGVGATDDGAPAPDAGRQPARAD